mmetsp:Transcript_94734/g.277106  ORF Transcript_94734/g.277106 Transcript_94734/m.277106 type:complete len:303 (+) Transcript_94734:275-1183(+)
MQQSLEEAFALRGHGWRQPPQHLLRGEPVLRTCPLVPERAQDGLCEPLRVGGGLPRLLLHLPSPLALPLLHERRPRGRLLLALRLLLVAGGSCLGRRSQRGELLQRRRQADPQDVLDLLSPSPRHRPQVPLQRPSAGVCLALTLREGAEVLQQPPEEFLALGWDGQRQRSDHLVCGELVLGACIQLQERPQDVCRNALGFWRQLDNLHDLRLRVRPLQARRLWQGGKLLHRLFQSVSEKPFSLRGPGRGRGDAGGADLARPGGSAEVVLCAVLNRLHHCSKHTLQFQLLGLNVLPLQLVSLL